MNFKMVKFRKQKKAEFEVCKAEESRISHLESRKLWALGIFYVQHVLIASYTDTTCTSHSKHTGLHVQCVSKKIVQVKTALFGN